ncbi:MAG: MBL fold metallo-hydrolase [Deltaproteobacteria bacterium]|jgi:glyoxylase-like metal-dependent hydrolase (beta-lactamase superfamily II)|nr:MBL fold metallo-hydrolase [Deltaproteobacteria bacterium]
MIPDIVQIRVGQTDNFAYLIICPKSLKALAVDPGRSPESLLQEIEKRKVQVEILANTHGHQDHIAGNQEVLEATGAKLAAHPLDVKSPDIALGEGSMLRTGLLEISVLHTPGHTPGSVVFNPQGALITGDTLFVTRCGRADFAGSDPAALYHSLMRLAAFPVETLVYPGHDYGPRPHSTIGFEREHNDYLNCPDLNSFFRLRMT